MFDGFCLEVDFGVLLTGGRTVTGARRYVMEDGGGPGDSSPGSVRERRRGQEPFGQTTRLPFGTGHDDNLILRLFTGSCRTRSSPRPQPSGRGGGSRHRLVCKDVRPGVAFQPTVLPGRAGMEQAPK